MPLTREQTDDIKSLINTSIKEMFTSQDFVEFVSKKLSELILDTIQNDIRSLSNKISVLEEDNNKLRMELKKTALATEKQEQYSRRNCLRIMGVNESCDENTEEVILDIINNKMKVRLFATDIERVHRLGKKQNINKNASKNSTRPIIVKFLNYKKRSDVFRNKKNLKSTKIVVKEDLTYNRSLLLRSCAEKFGFRHVWTSDGRIFVKIRNNINTIQSQDDFDALVRGNCTDTTAS